MRDQFRAFAEQVVADNDADLLDYGPEEQADRAIAALEKLHARNPLRPHVEEINAFGFGTAFTCFASVNGDRSDIYLRLTPLAEAIGIPAVKAAKLAELKHQYAIQDQREADEKTGVLGWDYLNDWVDLDLCLTRDDPEQNPDAGGRCWSHGSEWLVTLDRLPELVLLSPWGHEFSENASAMFSYAFKHAGMGARATTATTIVKHTDEDGRDVWLPGPSIADALAENREGISEEEARRRAFRGPSGVLGDLPGGPA